MPLVNFNSDLQKFPASSDVTPTASFATYENRRVTESSNGELLTAHTLEPGSVDTDESGATRKHKRSIQTSVSFANLDRIKRYNLNLQVLKACEKSDIPELKKLHSAGLDISSAFRIDTFQVFDPLHHAAETNDKELFLLLLEVAEAADSFKKVIHFHIYWLIQHDKVEFIQLLEDRKLLSDDYRIIHEECPEPVPMINFAINADATQVIEWLLGRNVDLTKRVHVFAYSSIHTISRKNAFDLALSKKDFTLLYKLLFNFAGANANTKSLPVTFWVSDLADSSKINDFAITLEILKNFQNFQEITASILESAYNNIEILEFLLCKFSKTVFHSLENMQASKFTVMTMLGTLSNRVISKYSIDHLQMLIQNRLPDLEGVNWLLNCCFKYSNANTERPALFKELSATTWLIRACTRLGAEITTAEYQPALLAIEEDETPCQKSLIAVTSGTDLKDSRESHVVPERPSHKEVDEKLELFFGAVLTKAISGRKRST